MDFRTRIGLVKILKSRSRPEKREPYICAYALKCFNCGKEMPEDNYLIELKRMGILEENWNGTSVGNLFWKRPLLRHEVEKRSKGYKKRWELEKSI